MQRSTRWYQKRHPLCKRSQRTRGRPLHPPVRSGSQSTRPKHRLPLTASQVLDDMSRWPAVSPQQLTNRQSKPPANFWLTKHRKLIINQKKHTLANNHNCLYARVKRSIKKMLFGNHFSEASEHSSEGLWSTTSTRAAASSMWTATWRKSQRRPAKLSSKRSEYRLIWSMVSKPRLLLQSCLLLSRAPTSANSLMARLPLRRKSKTSRPSFAPFFGRTPWNSDSSSSQTRWCSLCGRVSSLLNEASSKTISTSWAVSTTGNFCSLISATCRGLPSTRSCQWTSTRASHSLDRTKFIFSSEIHSFYLY